MKHILLGLLLVGGLIPPPIASTTLTLVGSNGENIELEVEKADGFLDVLDRIQAYFECEALVNDKGVEEKAVLPYAQLNFVVSHAGVLVRSKKEIWRDYQVPVSKVEKKDITYIIKTLAYDSILSVAAAKSSLKKAGDRIDHLHPYRFLMTIFTDEELKAGVHAIRDRGGWTWSGFIKGITGSLEEEARRKNLLQFTPDFAKKVKLEESLILPFLKQEKWNDLVNYLIDHVKREIDPNRYDM